MKGSHGMGQRRDDRGRGRRRTAAGVMLLFVAFAAADGRARKPETPPIRPDSCETDPGALVDRIVARWDGLAGSPGPAGGETLRRRVHEAVGELLALPEIARAIYGDGWDELRSDRRAALVDALHAALRDRVVAFLDASASGERPRLTPAGSEPRDDRIELEFELSTARTTRTVAAHVPLGAGDPCRIVNLAVGDEELVDVYGDRVREWIDEYSFEYAVAKLANRDTLVLEDFESSPIGGLPVGWGWKDSDDDKEKPYRVVEVDANRYLEARDEGQSVILGKEIAWNLEEYPYISFRVRVHEIPVGGDERYDDRVDSAAGLYVTYRKVLFGKVPESVKFVWSSTLPIGAAAIRNGIGRPWQVVFGSGEDGLGQWRTYTFDLRETYRATFGGGPPDKPLGIGILSDANSTGSRAFADYDDIVVLREAPEGVTGGVEQRFGRGRRGGR